MGVLEIDRKITGFLVICYNSDDVPDIGGMMWSVNQAEAQKIIFFSLAGNTPKEFCVKCCPTSIFWLSRRCKKHENHIR